MVGAGTSAATPQSAGRTGLIASIPLYRLAIACLAVQSVLLFSNLGLLPLWGDELFTLRTIQQPLLRMFETLRNDIHPPLYFLLERYWIRLPLPGDLVVRMRMLSAVFTVAGSAFAMWSLLPRLSDEAGKWFCLLLTASPCLMLYGRMGRSYSLQLLVTMVAIDQFLRYRENLSRGRAVAFGLAATLVMDTHYAPGAALIGGASLLLLIQTRSIVPLILPNLVIVGAYAPWLAASATAFYRWGTKSSFYRVTGQALPEEVVKTGYWGLSFLFGESISWWLFFLAIPLSGALVWLAWQGRSKTKGWGPLVAVIAVVGYLSVSRWVSYPFIPARLLFLLPFAYLLLAHGSELRVVAARWILGAMLVCSSLGLWWYFRVENYLNWGYAVPYSEIAQDIAGNSKLTLAVAGVFTDSTVLTYHLPATPYRYIEPPTSPEDSAAALSKEPWIRICLVRNTHDTSSDRYYARLEAALQRSFPVRRLHYYRPRTRLDGMLIAALGWTDAEPYFYEMVEFER